MRISEQVPQIWQIWSGQRRSGGFENNGKINRKNG